MRIRIPCFGRTVKVAVRTPGSSHALGTFVDHDRGIRIILAAAVSHGGAQSL